MQNKIVVMLIFFLFSVFGVTQADGLPPLTHRLTEINKNIPVPSLILQNMDEEIIDIKEFKNKVVVVNFWATWCPPCRREMGSLERLYQATKDNDVEILAVNIGENIDTVFSFMGTIEPSPNFQILFDPDGASMDHWKVRDLPTTFIISPNGTIAYKAVGGREFDHPDIQKNILNLSK